MHLVRHSCVSPVTLLGFGATTTDGKRGPPDFLATFYWLSILTPMGSKLISKTIRVLKTPEFLIVQNVPSILRWAFKMSLKSAVFSISIYIKLNSVCLRPIFEMW